MAGVNLGSTNFHPDPVAETASLDDGTRIQAESIFIIHGYNTRADAAEVNFAAFEQMVAAASRAGRQPRLIRVRWPGYRGERWFSRLYFAESARIATRCVDVFAKLLLKRVPQLGPAPHFVLIAHSLGCLIAEGVARRLATSAPAHLRVTLILMAAAIPDDGDYSAFHGCVGTAVLYSTDDEVLGKYFSVGQRQFAGKASQAVGLSGHPDQGVWDCRQPMKEHLHRDYWRRPDAADMVSALLKANAGRAAPCRDAALARPMGERELPKWVGALAGPRPAR